MNVKTICSGAFYHEDYSYRDDSVSGDHMLLLTRSRARLQGAYALEMFVESRN